MMTNTAFNLDAERVMRAMKIACWQQQRFYLQGVRVEPVKSGGALLIATNGAIMLVQYDPDGHAAEAATLEIYQPDLPPDGDEDQTGARELHWYGGRMKIERIDPGKTIAAAVLFDDIVARYRLLVTRLPEDYSDWRMAIGHQATPENDKKIGFDPKNRAASLRPDALGPLIADRRSFILHGEMEGTDQIQITYPDDPHSLGILMKSHTKKGPDARAKMLALIEKTAPDTPREA